jgi:hypothetical protein
MGVRPDFLKAGDAIELCAFALKTEYAARRVYAENGAKFVHGHVLLTPDGQMRLWGSYGTFEHCIRPDDQPQSWLTFVNTDARARQAWCQITRQAASPSRALSKAFVEAISRGMTDPCR